MLRGYTQPQMAAALSIELRSYQNYEAGDRFPSAASLRIIATKLRVSLDYLLCLNDEAPADA